MQATQTGYLLYPSFTPDWMLAIILVLLVTTDVELSDGATVVRAPSLVKTPRAAVKVFGTRAKIYVDAEQTRVFAFEGSVSVIQGKKTHEAAEGQGLIIKKGAVIRVTLPAEPEVLGPSEGQIVNERARLSWRPSTKISLVEVATDPELKQLVFTSNTDSDATELELPPGNYYWQVSAVDEQHIESAPQGPRLFVVEPKRATEPVSLPSTEPVREPLTLVVPAGGTEQKTYAKTFEIEGSVHPVTAHVTVNGVLVQPEPSGRFIATVLLAPGNNAITVEATDGIATEDAHIKVRAAKRDGPHRFGLIIAPAVPFMFRNQAFVLEAQLSYAFYFNPYFALKVAAGAAFTTTIQPHYQVPGVSLLYLLDAGFVTEFFETGFAVPYIEIDLIGLWAWHNPNFPDSFGDRGERVLRAQVAYAPSAGAGVRFQKEGGRSTSVGVHYRPLIDQGETLGAERSRFHSMLEVRASITWD